MITVKLKLHTPTKRKEQILTKNQREFTRCAQWWLNRIQECKSTSRSKLHTQYYKQASQDFSLLSANIQAAMNKAIETARAFYAKKGKKSFPVFRHPFACFRQDTFSIRDLCVVLRFLGRVKIALPFKVCSPNHIQYLQQPPKRAQLIERKGKWFLNVSYETESPKTSRQNMIGVDLGVKKLATVSNPEKSVNVFFSGNKAIYTRNKYHKYRQQIQQAKDSGQAKCGYRALKRISDKETRWMKDTNHKISKEIVQLAKEIDANIAVENLKGIRERIKATKRVKRMLHSWSFRQLMEFIEYKSAMAGVQVVPVDPRYTSQKCSVCGHISKSNRKSQARFHCKSCGFQINADLNAARNIALSALNL